MVYYNGPCPLCPKTLLDESTTRRHLLEHITELRTALAAKEKALRELQKLLRRHGNHLPPCKSCMTWWVPVTESKCDCGLDEALSSPTPAEPDQGRESYANDRTID